MDRNTNEMLNSELTTTEVHLDQVSELSDYHLALVGGGIADIIGV